MMVASAIMIVAFIMELFILSLILGKSIAIDDPLGFVLFIIQKIIVSGAFSSIYIFISLLTRNKAVGSVSAFLVGTGGLVMGLYLFFDMIGFNGSIIIDSTIYRVSQLSSTQLDPFTFIRVLAVCAAWTLFYGFLSNKVLKAKDVV